MDTDNQNSTADNTTLCFDYHDSNVRERKSKYFELLYKGYYASAAQFERALELISTGALLLSFAYMGNVIDYKTAEQKWVLVVSWSLLILTLIGALLSHHHSIGCHRSQIDFESKRRTRPPRTHTDWLAKACIGTLLLALIAMFLYIGLNIFNNEQETNSSATETTTTETTATETTATQTTTTETTIAAADSLERPRASGRRSTATTSTKEEVISTHSKEETLDSLNFEK